MAEVLLGVREPDLQDPGRGKGAITPRGLGGGAAAIDARAYTGRVTQRRVIGLHAPGAEVTVARREIKGSTTIVELLRMFPGGEAAALMSRLGLPCAHCGGAFHEPLTMAAKRHRRDPRAVLDAFRALEAGGPEDALLERASSRVD